MKSNPYSEYIHKLPVFQNCSINQLEGLLAGGEAVQLKHRDKLYCMGSDAQKFAVVLKGAFKLVKPGFDGDDIIVNFATPGDVIAGLIMSAPGSLYPVTVISMGETTVWELPRTTYLSAWAHNTEVLLKMNTIMFSRITHMQTLKSRTKAPLEEKVALQIVALIERYGSENKNMVPVPLTRQEIADSLGARVESVIRVMSDWSKRGIIQTKGQQIHILQSDKLLEIMKGKD